MGPLRNQRHERFCLALAEGRTIDESFTLAGYSKNTGNACRLNGNESVRARVAELQAQQAADSKVTVESICRELDEANAVAKAKGQAAAMVSAATLRAKLAGLMVERVEVGNVGDFDAANSFADVADGLISEAIERFAPVDETDRQGLIDLVKRQASELREHINSIKARPITAERVDARNLTVPWRQLRQHSAPTRLKVGNGSAPVR
jgi:hypothetical protein